MSVHHRLDSCRGGGDPWQPSEALGREPQFIVAAVSLAQWKLARKFSECTILKNSLYSSTLRKFVRKRWNHVHKLAFLLDSQAKFP